MLTSSLDFPETGFDFVFWKGEEHFQGDRGAGDHCSAEAGGDGAEDLAREVVASKHTISAYKTPRRLLGDSASRSHSSSTGGAA